MSYINHIHNQQYCFVHARANKPCTKQYCNREFPVSIQVQGCGETSLYTLQGAQVYTSTRCLAHDVAHSMITAKEALP